MRDPRGVQRRFRCGGYVALVVGLPLLLPADPGLSQSAREEVPAPPAETATLVEPSPQELFELRLASLPVDERDWLVRVQGLMTPAELQYFLELEAPYRRAAFREAFWDVRSAGRSTGLGERNPLKSRYDELVANNPGFTTRDPRALAFLLNGPPGRWTLPDGRPVSVCYSRTSDLEIWFYGGSERTSERFPLIFLRRNQSQEYTLWRPGENLRPARRSGLPTREAALLCADELAAYASGQITRVARYDQLLEQVLAPPQVSDEWLRTFRGGTAEIPEGAELFDAEARVRFPGRNQSRTAVQVDITIPLDQAPPRRIDGQDYFDYRLVGEVVRDGELFESFDYRFDGPVPPDAEGVPIGFQRFLRPGSVQLEVLVQDVFSGRYAHFEASFDVPSPEGRDQVARPRLASLTGADGRETATVQLIPPGQGLIAGRQRFVARTTGDLDRVAFLVDGRQVLSKRTAPFSVELDLGEVPQPRRVRAVAYREDLEVATDQLWLNQGNQRLRIELAEPRNGGIYPGSLTARANVVLPDLAPSEGGETVYARVDFYLDDELVGEFERPPYRARMAINTRRPAVVRAVATLPDGTTAEDAVVVNASITDVLRVQLAEVPVVVTDLEGRAIADLGIEDFRLFENDQPRALRGAAAASALPTNVLLLVDKSSSMLEHRDSVREASVRFARSLLEQQADHAGAALSVLTFADRATVDLPLSRDPVAVERALAGILPLGGTALYDATLTALNEFEGLSAGALVVFSDGRDENSRFGIEEVLQAARQRGVAIYTVALATAEGPPDPALERLSSLSGGRSFTLEQSDPAQLDVIYDAIRRELAGRYLLTYAPVAGGGAAVRELRVEVAPEAVEGDVTVRSRSSIVVQ